jgi:hypothetical protein
VNPDTDGSEMLTGAIFTALLYKSKLLRHKLCLAYLLLYNYDAEIGGNRSRGAADAPIASSQALPEI